MRTARAVLVGVAECWRQCRFSAHHSFKAEYSPNLLLRQGWRLDSLKIGDPVTVNGYLATNSAKTSARRVTLTAR